MEAHMICRGPDVLIVGAGPAGSSLALHLARAGLDVLILDRAHFPRDKPCGDCLSPGAVAELERLGLKDRLRESLAPRDLRGWRVEAPDGQVLSASYGRSNGAAPLSGWAVRRRDLDAALLAAAERAGTRVRFGVRVFDLDVTACRASGVIVREGGGTATRVIPARVVVGADGLRSVVRRRLGLDSRPPRLRKIAIIGHLAGGNGGAMGVLRVRAGRCSGYAPLNGGGNLTLVVPEREAAEIAGDTRAFFIDALSTFPEARQRIDQYGLDETLMVTGPFDQPVRRPWSAGVLLVGDAAGYYDPFTGQGVYQALRTARVAAQAILAVLDGGERERAVFARYGRWVRRTLAPTRGVQRLIEAVIQRPRLMSRFIGALGEPDDAPATRLLRVTGDLAHPVTLADPLLWARLLHRMSHARR